MELGLIWFSFRRDALSVVESVKSARVHYPAAPFVVANDLLDPIPDIQIAILIDLGVEIIGTSYHRGGNLRGRVGLLGQLSTMLQVCEAHRLTHLLKIDSDTVLLDTSWVRPSELLGFGYAYYWSDTHTAGMAYVIARNTVRSILSYLDANPELGRGGEDKEISKHAKTLGLTSEAIEVTPSNLCAISYKWTQPDYDYTSCYVVTVGQGRPGRRCDEIELEALAMAKLHSPVRSRHL